MQFKTVERVLKGCDGQRLGAGFTWLSLVPAGLQEHRQSCGAGNATQGLGCSLPLLSVLSGMLVGRGWGGCTGLPEIFGTYRPQEEQKE